MDSREIIEEINDYTAGKLKYFLDYNLSLGHEPDERSSILYKDDKFKIGKDYFDHLRLEVHFRFLENKVKTRCYFWVYANEWGCEKEIFLVSFKTKKDALVAARDGINKIYSNNRFLSEGVCDFVEKYNIVLSPECAEGMAKSRIKELNKLIERKRNEIKKYSAELSELLGDKKKNEKINE